jgi:hypothetical protein
LVYIRALFEIHLSSKDIALIGVFGALSAFPLLLTNVFNLVALTHVPGTNGIYVQFIVAMILWVGIGIIGKYGSATAVSAVSSMVAVIIPGGPPVFVKPLLIPFNIVTGFIIDLALLKSKSSALNRVIAGFFGILRGLQTLVVQTFLGLPIAISLIVVSVDCASGAIGANVGVQVLRQLYHSGMPISSRGIT